MIKFFRKIRRKLIDEGNPKAYLLYGIGEIFLVVIGILIAVQLDNWNQKRIRADQIEVLLNKVEEDLIHNIEDMNRVIQSYQISDSLTRKVINNEVTIEDYYNNEKLANLLYMVDLLKLNTENIEKLIHNEEIISSKYEITLNIAKELIQSSIYIEHTEEPLKDFYYGNLDFLMSHAFWMAKSDSVSIEKRYHFFTTDENYKKRVLNYWAKTSEMTLTTMFHRSVSMQLLGKLKAIRQNFGARNLHQLYISLNLNSFKEIDCEDVASKNNNQLYKNDRFLITNMSDKQVHVIGKDSEGDIFREKKIKPGDFAIFLETSREVGAIDKDYFSTIELHQDNQCIKKYVEERNGYIIIE